VIVTKVRREGGLGVEGEASGRVCSGHTEEIVIRPMRSLTMLCSLCMLLVVLFSDGVMGEGRRGLGILKAKRSQMGARARPSVMPAR
jgi:hypothetical protein